MKYKKRFAAILVLSGLVIVLLFPRTIILSPARELKITNIDGKPIKNAIVRQVWYQYSLRVNDEEDFLSGSDGKVSIPERNIKTRNIDLLKGCISNFKTYFIHASCSTRDSIGIFPEGYEDVWFHDGNGLNRDIIIMHPGKNQLFK
jgi:hypothetical protein